MPDNWMPSTEQVRSHYVFDQSDRWDRERGEAFDRWLAAHDREVAAQALEDIAHEWGDKTWLRVLVQSLVERAATLRSGTEGKGHV